MASCKSKERRSTRPWKTYGEGPTKTKAGAFGESGEYTAGDIRFTKKRDALYAIVMDWPKGETAIASLGSNALPEATIERVDLLGGPEIRFRRDPDALRLGLPAAQDGAFMPALRIRGRGLT